MYARSHKSVALSWNGDMLHRMNFSKTSVTKTYSVVYVFDNGVLVIGQFVETEDFGIRIVYFLKQKD